MIRDVDITDHIWHRALEPELVSHLRLGDQSLAAVLKFRGRVMNGGLPHVVETSTDVELDTAEAGCRWLGTVAVADLINAVQDSIREKSAR